VGAESADLVVRQRLQRRDVSRVSAVRGWAATAFPDLRVEFLHEVAKDGLVAHHVVYTGTHIGRYFDLDPTAKQVRLEEMVFHRMTGGSIAESWLLTYPGSMYDALVERNR
jgi:predicted ester cyclase